eukprot:465328_1
MSQKVVFVLGQRVDARDSCAYYRGWYGAIIKEVGTNQNGKRFVRIGFIDIRWKDEKYDIVWTEDVWNAKIRDPETKLPYSKKNNLKPELSPLENDIIRVKSLKKTVSKHEKEIKKLNTIENETTKRENSLKAKVSELEKRLAEFKSKDNETKKK